MIKQTSAPAKVILFGEHAVVYGIPAIAAPISSLRATASVEPTDSVFQVIAKNLTNQGISLTADMKDNSNPLTKIVTLVLNHFSISEPPVKITIDSEIPIASGLGSGAAVSTALGRAVALACDVDLADGVLNQLVFETEKILHGTPSGIDNTVVVYEQPIYFIKGEPIVRLTLRSPFNIVIADTGQTALTYESVSDVRKLYATNPTRIQSLFDQIGDVVRQAKQYIEKGNSKKLGEVMSINHAYLQELTVSSPTLDRLVEVALSCGALGAKLSGGGRGGNMIALVDEADVKKVKSGLMKAGAVRVVDSEVR